MKNALCSQVKLIRLL